MTDKPIQGNDNMNTRLTIRPILTAAALAAVIGMTSAVSVAWAEGVGAQGATEGANGRYQPSPFVDYDNTWLTGITACASPFGPALLVTQDPKRPCRRGTGKW